MQVSLFYIGVLTLLYIHQLDLVKEQLHMINERCDTCSD